jgi:hypothetical protein
VDTLSYQCHGNDTCMAELCATARNHRLTLALHTFLWAGRPTQLARPRNLSPPNLNSTDDRSPSLGAATSRPINPSAAQASRSVSPPDRLVWPPSRPQQAPREPYHPPPRRAVPLFCSRALFPGLYFCTDPSDPIEKPAPLGWRRLPRSRRSPACAAASQPFFSTYSLHLVIFFLSSF